MRRVISNLLSTAGYLRVIKLNCIFYEIFNEYQLALIHCYIDYSEPIFRSKIISKSELYIFIKAKNFTAVTCFEY